MTHLTQQQKPLSAARLRAASAGLATAPVHVLIEQPDGTHTTGRVMKAYQRGHGVAARMILIIREDQPQIAEPQQ